MESLGSGKVNSKACDQCYRCKVKCTMEQSGCARCRMTKGTCTYSLGKWMGRPKKSTSSSRRPTLTRARDEAGSRSRPHKRARSISSAEYVNDDDEDDDDHGEGRYAFGIQDADRRRHGPPTPNDSPHFWDVFSPAMLGMNASQSLVPYQMDDFANLHVDNGAFGSPMHNRPIMISPATTNEGETADAATISRIAPSTASSSSASQEQGEEGQAFAPLPSRCVGDGNGAAAPAGPEHQTFQPTPMEPINSPRCEALRMHFSHHETTHRCSCSRAALDSLDRLSTRRDGAGYVQCLEAVQLAFRTAEEMVLCALCAPGLVISKCCLLLSSAYELLNDVSIGSDHGEAAARSRVKEDIRRVKRRATMLFAGLGTLQDLDAPASPVLAGAQAEFLTGLAKAWGMLSEP
ncbi:zn2 cys6 dna-binding protein [Diplodia corticola]|uniref:Zn2 cys6 dna-binding protein n=1 Tax=Diplodia corticola TaxID=236234 RepID=A0A1J9S2C5_9PEZI|nr:zn2 cys6 dna-binding protein [Diplodia corticola]OJD34156.1 zn2 cys6 dna-binding protein [Diplodia corticola]